MPPAGSDDTGAGLSAADGSASTPPDAPGSPLALPLQLGTTLHIPRSPASFAFALDELEREFDEIDEEETETALSEGRSPPAGAAPRRHIDFTSLATLGEEGEREVEEVGYSKEEALRRAAAAEALESHPLEFVSQFPNVAIVTTASLPWLTGTAVNPALRAAYLWRRGHAVTLVVPWVAPADQPRLFPDGTVYQTPEAQAAAVVEALQKRVPFPLPPHAGRSDAHAHGFSLVFYPGRYEPALGSIIPTVDIQALLPAADCIVLEEPEHLTWYHTGRRWTRAFPRHVPVVGIMHTNYVDYARRVAGEAAAATLKRLNRFLCRQHTHKVIKLSDAVQDLVRQETCFVHGVSHAFLAVGEERAEAVSAAAASGVAPPPFSRGIYFLGKALWAKGFEELLDRFSEHKARCDIAGKAFEAAAARAGETKAGGSEMAAPALRRCPEVDVYGKGEQLGAIQAAAEARELPLRFRGAKDHLSPDMAAYRAFVNPSTSDVVATTTAEALAMGKWVLVPRHPCNDFFSSFANCLVYASPEEFSAAVERCLAHDPAPLTPEELRRLSWECATDRFLFCCASTEVGRGPPLARVAAKTGWLGYNVGYQVYAVATGVLDWVQKGKSKGLSASTANLQNGNAAAEGDGGGRGGDEERVQSHALSMSMGTVSSP